jgi:GxxExxY protein
MAEAEDKGEGLDAAPESVRRLSQLDADLTGSILGAAIRVHKELGPGMLESAYRACISYELESQGLHVERERAVPARFRGLTLEGGDRLDLLVERRIVLELKCVKDLDLVHVAQLVTYLRLADLPLGFLLNFRVALMKYGIRRIINDRFLGSFSAPLPLPDPPARRAPGFLPDPPRVPSPDLRLLPPCSLRLRVCPPPELLNRARSPVVRPLSSASTRRRRGTPQRRRARRGPCSRLEQRRRLAPAGRARAPTASSTPPAAPSAP